MLPATKLELTKTLGAARDGFGPLGLDDPPPKCESKLNSLWNLCVPLYNFFCRFTHPRPH